MNKDKLVLVCTVCRDPIFIDKTYEKKLLQESEIVCKYCGQNNYITKGLRKEIRRHTRQTR